MESFPSLKSLGNIYEIISKRSIKSESFIKEVNVKALFLLNNGFSNKNLYIAHSSSINFFTDLLATWKVKSTAICIESTVGKTDLTHMNNIVKPDLFLIDKKNSNENFLDIAKCIDLSRDINSKNEEQKSDFESFGLLDPILILFTSGSTGLPKGVVHTRKSLENKWFNLKKNLNFSDFKETLCPLSTSFGHGLICNSLFPLLNSGNLHILEDRDLKSILKIPNYLNEKNITFMSSVPSIWNILLTTSKSINSNSIKRVHIGSAPLTVRLALNIQRWFGNNPLIVNTYGITETGSWIAGGEILNNNLQSRDGYIGKVWDGEFKIIKNYEKDIKDAEFLIAKEGEIGEIWVKTDSIMKNYLGDKGMTNQVIKDGWFRTGDLAYKTGNCDIVLQGRIKNEINVGGMKVSPEEVDIAIEEIDTIKEACTYRVDDPLLGEVPHSIIKLTKNSNNISHNKIFEILTSKLSLHKIPKKFKVVEEVPKNSRGKVDRNKSKYIGQNIEPIK